MRKWWDPRIFQGSYVTSIWSMQGNLGEHCEHIPSIQVFSHT